MTTIVFFHQSADMYGSDRTLITLIEGLDKTIFRPVVLLPCSGPLSEALTNAEIETYVVPLVKISRATFTITGLLRLPFLAVNSIRAINRVLAVIPVDLVHSNTLAVMSGAIWARLYGKPHVWHVHEIVHRPRLVGLLFPLLVRLLADRVVANSEATRTWLVSADSQLERKTITIWNGLERGMPHDSTASLNLRNELGLGQNDVLVALVGRINRWKGQSLLVKAAEMISLNGGNNIYYLIVGSAPFGQQYFRDELLALIAHSQVQNRITVRDFTTNIWVVWDACDMAVVPSTEPEPFGMVALEAMAAGKPVIGAAHGGLTEIIVDGNTGILVTPRDVVALAEAIVELSKSPMLRKNMGLNGANRQKKLFSLHAYQSNFIKLYLALSSNS